MSDPAPEGRCAVFRRRNHPVTLALTILLAAVSGCANSNGASDQSAKSADQVEVFSWWQGPGEKEGYDALIAYFKDQNPGVDFINASVAGGAGSNARAVLASRMAANDPPDSYQVHAGQEEMSDVKAGKVQDLSYLFDRNGWRDKFPKAVMNAITIGGKIYSVPVTIHRSNLLWYNVKAMRAAGIAKPPATWPEFMTIAAKLKAKKITPLAIGPEWTQKHLLENVLLGELGVAKYSALWTGKASWLGADVRAAVKVFSNVLAVSDVKTFDGDWQSALDKVIDGKAAYTVMGDWADAYLSRAKGMTFGTDYDAVPSPGTDGVFNFLSDAFMLPTGAPHRAAAEKWLEACASVPGQEALSLQKRSLTARVDSDKTKYKDYLASALAAWQNPATVVVGSATHGVLVDTVRSGEIDTALSKFVGGGAIDQFLKSMDGIYA
jgi:glucose/mannose transport system substrate-binding protein